MVMSIAITEEHVALAETARDLLTSRDARGAGRAMLEAPTEELPKLWDDIVGLGWLGLHVPEEHGGSGYGLEELVIVVEEMGRAVAPGPFVPTVIASAVLAATADDETKARLLPGLADGSSIGAVALGGAVSVSGGRASGPAGTVLGGGLAHILLIASGDDVAVVALDGGADGRDAPQPRPVTPFGTHHPRRRTRHRDSRCAPGPRRPGAGDPLGRCRRRCTGSHRDGCGVLEGTDPVRPTDRHVPGRQAPLRQHGGGHRTRHQRSVGRSSGEPDRGRPAVLRSCSRSHARRTRG